MRVIRVHVRGWAIALAVCLLALAGATGAQAAPASSSALQRDLDRLVADGVPGAIALSREGGREYHAASGVADLKTKRPIRASDRFRIASITKAYASTAALQLVGEGRLGLDDSVEKWLPGVVPNGAAITVRQLMNHTSGIPDYIDLPFYLGILKDPLKFHQPLDLVRRAVAMPPTFPPGTSFAYSNTDYVLLGLVIAAVDGAYSQPWERITAPVAEVYRRVIAPLGVRRTSFPVVDPEIRGPHSRGYVIDPPPEWGLPKVLDTTRSSPSWAWTAGAIIATLDDVAAFHRALFAGRLLRPSEQRELLTTVPAGGAKYGLGVFEIQTPCGSAWGHTGGIPSASSASFMSLDGSRQAVLMANRDGNTWTDQLGVDYTTALITAYCGEKPSTRATRRLAPTVLSHLKNAD